MTACPAGFAAENSIRGCKISAGPDGRHFFFTSISTLSDAGAGGVGVSIPDLEPDCWPMGPRPVGLDAARE
jgi:hypothetical protein